MLRYLSSILVFIFFTGFILSCEQPGTPPAREKNKNENVLRYDVSAPFTSLNPTYVYASGSNHIFPLLYSYLFVPNANGELEPDLALKWTYDSESFTWTIHLRKDALFHNKHPVTSRDVQYALEGVLKNNRPALFSLIDRIFPLSDTVICIGLKRNDPEFLQKIWDMEILPQPHEDKIDYYNHPIGSGPFRFKYRKGEKEVCLEANKDYFHGRPSIDRVVFYFQPDKEKSWTRVLSGETDIAQEISPKNYEMMKQYGKRYYFDLYPLRWYTILLYNTTDPLFSDPRVRLAFSYAIDRAYIVKKILRGFGRIAVGPMGVDSPYHNPEVQPIPYNPKKGLALLKQAGWSYDHEGRYLEKGGKGFEFTILVFKESQIEKKVAQYLQICLNDLGIKVRLQSVPFEELKRRYYRNNQFQAVLTELRGVYRDPEFLKQSWSFDRPKRSEAGSFEDPEVTRLICQALDEKDPFKQKALFYKIDARIQALQPGTFLFHKTAIDVMSKRFKLPFPFSLTHEGIYRLRYASLKSG
ncbi:MAG: hypothetical protein DRH17_03495 [Deltaproteobacteria bacterium]|nr:MAG: hypothetical protein DRH17_03495 [Deltaproteobacteria bacterium]